MRVSRVLVVSVAAVLVTVACADSGSTPTMPTPAIADSAGGPVKAASGLTPVAAREPARPLIAFPGRGDSMAFKFALEAKYRDHLRRSSGSSFVDGEGTVVWLQEYLRYRINLCAHATAVALVIAQIDGRGIGPVCGNGTAVTFPARFESLDFMRQLDGWYRDILRRSLSPTYVDPEGNAIWIAEYIRYRLSTCSHNEALVKVFDQIDGRGVPSDCTPPPPPPRPPSNPTPTGSGAYFAFGTDSATCRCWIGTIRLSIDGNGVGSMTCSGSRTVDVNPGRRNWSACDATGDCLSGSEDIGAGQTGGVTLTCR